MLRLFLPFYNYYYFIIIIILFFLNFFGGRQLGKRISRIFFVMTLLSAVYK